MRSSQCQSDQQNQTKQNKQKQQQNKKQQKQKPRRTGQHERQSDILTWPAQLMDDVYCIIERIGMARNNKTKEQNQEVTSPYKDF